MKSSQVFFQRNNLFDRGNYNANGHRLSGGSDAGRMILVLLSFGVFLSYSLERANTRSKTLKVSSNLSSA